jgi:hypothetical protein
MPIHVIYSLAFYEILELTRIAFLFIAHVAMLPQKHQLSIYIFYPKIYLKLTVLSDEVVPYD